MTAKYAIQRPDGLFFKSDWDVGEWVKNPERLYVSPASAKSQVTRRLKDYQHTLEGVKSDMAFCKREGMTREFNRHKKQIPDLEAAIERIEAENETLQIVKFELVPTETFDLKDC